MNVSLYGVAKAVVSYSNNPDKRTDKDEAGREAAEMFYFLAAEDPQRAETFAGDYQDMIAWVDETEGDVIVVPRTYFEKVRALELVLWPLLERYDHLKDMPASVRMEYAAAWEGLLPYMPTRNQKTVQDKQYLDEDFYNPSEAVRDRLLEGIGDCLDYQEVARETFAKATSGIQSLVSPNARPNVLSG